MRINPSLTPGRPAEPSPRPGQGPVVLVSKPVNYILPLSYAYLAGYLREKGEPVRILFKETDAATLVRQIMALNPLLVGFGNLYPELPETAHLIALLNRAGRTFPIVVGGQMVTPTPEFALQVTGADYGVIGEGEIILLQLTQALREGRDPTSIKGLVFRRGQDIINNGPGETIDMSQLPAVPYDMFPLDKWLPIGRWHVQNHFPHAYPHWRYSDRVINVHGGRGCPFYCNFCYHHSKPRYRPIPAMIDQAIEELERFQANMLYFSDDLVLASPNRARQLIQELSRFPKPIDFSASTRFDILSKIDDSLLSDLKKSGCRIMGLGIESGSDRMLKIIGKNCTAASVLQGLARLKDAGIYPTVTIMVGQQTETDEDVDMSVNVMREAVRYDPNIAFSFTLTTPFPGSPLYDEIFKKGILRDHRDFYNLYFSTPGEFKQVVNLSAMSEARVLEQYQRISRIYLEEKAKTERRTVVTVQADPQTFRQTMGVPFVVDQMLLDCNQSLLVRCVSADTDLSEAPKYFQGRFLSELLGFARAKFPDRAALLPADAVYKTGPFVNPQLAQVEQNGKIVSAWFAVYY